MGPYPWLIDVVGMLDKGGFCLLRWLECGGWMKSEVAVVVEAVDGLTEGLVDKRPLDLVKRQADRHATRDLLLMVHRCLVSCIPAVSYYST